MNHEEIKNLGWDKRGLVLMLGNDSLLFVSCDDEGNNAGTLSVRQKTTRV